MVTITLTAEQAAHLQVALDTAERERRSAAKMWRKLTNDPALPNAARNAEVCTEDADRAKALSALVLAARIESDRLAAGR